MVSFRKMKAIGVMTITMLTVAFVVIAFLDASAPAGATATTTRTLTARQLGSATLPGGACSSGPPKSSAIPFSNGHGQVGASTVNYLSAWIVGSPVPINFGGRGHAGLAAAIECSEGGSFEWSQVFVFEGSARHLKVLFGPIFPHSYNIGTFGIVGAQSTGVSAKSHILTVREEFQGGPKTCGSTLCMEKTSAAWGLSSGNHPHLVIIRPSPHRVVVTVRATPKSGAVGGGTPPAIAAGKTVNAICTTASLRGSRQTELDNGTWLPSSDLRPIHLPDCDAGAVPVASTTTSTSASTSTTSTPSIPTTTTTASAAGSPPCTVAALTAAAQAADVPNVTGVDPEGYGCSGDWAYAGVDLGSQDEVTWIFMTVNGSWQRTVVQLDCQDDSSSPSLPPSILQAACNSN